MAGSDGGWVRPPDASGPTGSSGPGAPASGGQRPVVGWAVPVEPEGLGIGEVGRQGWRIARANLGTYVAISAVPILLVDLLGVPFWIAYTTMFQGMVDFWTTLDLERYRFDPEALQRDMQAAMQPPTELIAFGSVGLGLATIVSVIATAALAAAMLTAVSGGRPSFGSAYRSAAGHVGAVVVPALAIGLGYAVIATPLTLIGGGFGYPGDVGEYATRAAVGALFGLVALLVEIAVIYYAVRWSMYFQVVVGEGHGLRAALRRSSDLSRGVRIRIALILLVWGFGFAVLLGMPAGLAALIVGLAASSFVAGFMTYLTILTFAGIVAFPFFLGMLTHIYRVRTDALAPSPASEAAPAV